MRLLKATGRLVSEAWEFARAWIRRAGKGRVLYACAAAASLLFLASVVFGADQYTGLSGRPTTRATVGAW